jgi:hypothetical protein
LHVARSRSDSSQMASVRCLHMCGRLELRLRTSDLPVALHLPEVLQ